VPAESELTDLGRRLRDSLPSWLREDPDMRAVYHCYAMEAERQREMAREVRDNFIPGRLTEFGLAWWEAILGMPTVLSEPEVVRRAAVLSRLLASVPDSRGLSWEEQLALLVPGATYAEDAATYTLTPAHLDLILVSGEGFLLDLSELDQETFHPS
jgi:hypothetical protein